MSLCNTGNFILYIRYIPLVAYKFSGTNLQILYRAGLKMWINYRINLSIFSSINTFIVLIVCCLTPQIMQVYIS